ncbi:helix-turn-helix domain-containing protein [Actinocorallia sp. A-T 12471]|uniref:PucR family transcriptional regulator n=1 Tax=Actinocorallia sp. A-T 12471 TaxID=3089813 RepID=UPI0029CAD232|nr:helix-turn-helix domain-containing protein [Actinocorallia sp. A-T 12471]MDX6741297.1 helix-turn-helix domain-containing protein [Actinocorallia sp. A-T 12471]
MGLLHGVLDYEAHRETFRGLVRTYRPELDVIADEGVAEIEKSIPEYVRPHDPRYAGVVRTAVEYAIGHWFDMLVDPDLDSTETIAFFRALGVGEAREARSMEAWQSAARVGTRATIEYITRRNAERGVDMPGAVVGQLTNSVLVYIDILAEAVAAGHAEAGAREVGEFQGRLRRMLELLLEGGDRALKDVRELAAKTGWAIPQSVAVVAVHERDAEPARRPALPSEVLVGLHLAEPCLLVPDPGGPGRRRMLEHGLRGWFAALGPSVPVTEAARSRAWANRALDLARRGHLPDDGLVVAEEHLPTLFIVPHADLVDRVAERRLGPLLELRPRQRRVLAETLLACLESGFNATEVAQRLHMHAQTIRYRVRQLEGLLGDEIYHPDQRLELHMVLHGWLALNPATGDDPS